MPQASGPSNMIWESTPQALYDTSIPSALLSSRLLPRKKRSLRAADAVKIHKSPGSGEEIRAQLAASQALT